MKFVAKGAEPRAFRQWKVANRKTEQNLAWNGGRLPKNDIRAALLKEQGWLCGYTMLRIEEGDCHIEHLLPRSLHEDQILNFKNLVACFPANGGDTAHGYGAPLKADTNVMASNFVFPTNANCESQFEYERNGCMVGMTAAARHTIILLGLNHKDLVEKRAAALAAEGLVTSLNSNLNSKRRMNYTRLSANAAKQLSAIAKERDGQNRFLPFCTMISRFAETYAEKAEGRANRLRRKSEPI